jgi:hypothetical protein
VVDPPGASVPLCAALIAVVVPPDVLTAAFHAETTRRSVPSVQVTDHFLVVSADWLATVTLTIWPPPTPLPHCVSTRAVAEQPPAKGTTGALPATAGDIANAATTPVALKAAHRARTDGRDSFMVEPSGAGRTAAGVDGGSTGPAPQATMDTRQCQRLDYRT